MRSERLCVCYKKIMVALMQFACQGGRISETSEEDGDSGAIMFYVEDGYLGTWWSRNVPNGILLDI